MQSLATCACNVVRRDCYTCGRTRQNTVRAMADVQVQVMFYDSDSSCERFNPTPNTTILVTPVTFVGVERWCLTLSKQMPG